jgi:hypothetical protein
MSDISVSNPGAREVKGRRKNLNKIWSGKEWKERKAVFLKTYPNCEMHKGVIIKGSPLIVPATVPHHPYKTSYKEGYSDLDLSQCVAYCQKCHFAIHHGMKLCETCGEHYHPWDAPMCRYCFDKANPDIVAKREIAKEDFQQKLRLKKKGVADKRKELKQKHPCKKYLASGSCKGSMIGSKCPYGIRTAKLKCGGFEEKVKK